MFLYSIIVAPIEVVVDWVFTFFTIKFSSFGVIGAIFGVSLVINFLALPIYNVADALQAKERKISKEMEPRIKRIKMAFKGDERFMMLQTYYRECKYNPIYTLRSSLSILIEIPFFIAAYHYLSHAEALKGVSFWIFKDLGTADSFFHIGSFPINVLPILMTVINLVSGAIYSKDTTLREKIQIYVLAAVFLALLYNSPSGLVIYWILNNLFSLAKNVVLKMKNPGKVLLVIVDVILGLFACYFLFFNDGSIKKRLLLAVFTAAVILFPVLKRLLLFTRNDGKLRWPGLTKSQNNSVMTSRSRFVLFLFSSVSLALLCGILLPSNMISTSVEEFSFLGSTSSPLAYVSYSFAFYLGLFVFWSLLIYFMFGNNVKNILTYFMFLINLAAICNAFIFKNEYGTLNYAGELSNPNILRNISIFNFLGPFFAFAIITAIFFIFQHKNKIQLLTFFILAINVSSLGISIKNINFIQKEFKKILLAKTQKEEIETVINLNKDGKNVVVFFLDRAMGLFVPYIFEQFPQLKNIYTGWTFYPNTVSFSNFTNEGMLGLYGGYEYSVDNINKRKDELLRKKNDESQLVVPRIFNNASWNTMLINPQYVNYDVDNEKSLFDQYPEIKTEYVSEEYANLYLKSHPELFNSHADDLCKNRIVRFCFMQTLIPFLRNTYYNGGKYYSGEVSKSISLKTNLKNFLDGYAEIYYLPKMTKFTSDKNSYTMFHSNITHDVKMLKEPDYTPGIIDDSDLNNIHTLYPYTSVADNESSDLAHYECNAAAFLQLAKWIKLLKENDCYDNTRIIFVGDHGRGVIPYLAEGFPNDGSYAFFHTLLMVKDFDASGPIQTDNSFMTNADTPWLSIKDLSLEAKNPFSQKEISKSEANKEKSDGVNVWHCLDWQVNRHKEDTRFATDIKKAWHVSDNIFDFDNWIPMTEWLKSHPNDIAAETSKGDVK